jgi:hypothetical protein
VKTGGSDVLVLKVDVDEDHLYPDEDFIAWELARNGEGLLARDLVSGIDPGDYQEHWRHSLERNGLHAEGACRENRGL